MKTQTVFSSRLMIFLSSMALGCLAAFIVPALFFNIFLLSFPQQILIIFSVWFCFGIIFYFFISWGVNRFRVLSTLFTTDLSFQQMIRKIFLAIFFLFPACLIAFQHFREFFQILIQGKVYDPIGWLGPQEDAGSFLIGVLTLSLFLILMPFIVARKPRLRQYLDDMPDYYYIIFILLAGISIRLFFIHLVNTQPISDFGVINSDAILVSQGARPENMYVAVHVITTMIYGFLYAIFGPDLMVIKVFHIVLYALSGIFIYYVGKENFGNKLWAGIAGVLVVSWPSLALYSNVLTPEHLFIFVECLFIFAASRFFQRQGTGQSKVGVLRDVFGFVVIGSLLGIMGMFRPFSQLFLIAFLITLFIYKPSFDLKRITLNITALLLFAWLLSNVPGIVASHYHNQFGNVRPCNLLVGMNIDASGRYNVEDTALCSKILSSTSNESVVTQKIMGIVFERLHTKQDYLLPFLDKKFAILWVNSNGIIYWALQLAKGDDPVFALDVAQKINLVDFAMMFVATMACVAGVVLAFFRDVKPVIFFSLLSLFAFNLMEAFFEVQTRYRTVIMPLFIFFACWTFATIYSSTRKNGSGNWIMPNCEEGIGKTMVTKILKYKQIWLSLFLGSITSWLMREQITPLLLGGKNFDARSELVKIGILISLIVLTSLLYLCLISMEMLQTTLSFVKRYPVHSSFFVVFGAVLFLNLSHPRPFMFYCDSGQYWDFSSGFIKQGVFSVINYDNPFRGYLFPLIIFVVKKLAYLAGSSEPFVYEVVMSFVYAVFLAICVPAFIQILFNIKTGFLQNLGFSVLALFFWQSSFFYPLSDLLSFIFLVFGTFMVMKFRVHWWAVVFAGLFWGGASLIRPSNVITLPFLLLWVIFYYHKEIHLTVWHTGVRLMAILAGLIIVFAPQMAINIIHFGIFSPLVQTGLNRTNMFVAQLGWGIVIQKYETNVGPTYPSAQVFFIDRQGENILIKSGYQSAPYMGSGGVPIFASTNSLAEYFRLLLKYPFDFMAIYARHLFNGLDIVYNSVYVYNVYDGAIFLRFVNYSLWFLVVMYIASSSKLKAQSYLTSPFILPIIFALPSILSIPTAIEVRFMLPVHLMAYALVAFWVLPRFFLKNFMQKKNVIRKYILGYAFFILLCFMLSSNTYMGLQYGPYVLTGN